MTNQSSVPKLNQDLLNMLKVADFIGDRIRDRKGDMNLPWTTTKLDEAEAKRFTLRSYVYTIYHLNSTAGTVINFREFPLDQWNVLPGFSDLVIPETVKLTSGASDQIDLLDRSRFFISSVQQNGVDACKLMTLDEFNAFTSVVQNKFRLDAAKIQTFKALRINKGVSDVLKQSACNGVMVNRGEMPLALVYNFHSKDYLDFNQFDVQEKFLRSRIAESYTI